VGEGDRTTETQIKPAGIGTTTIFLVIPSHESLLSIGRHESLEAVGAVSFAEIAAFVSFIIEGVIVWKEHNR
jgi:hypothetical protein